MWRRLGPGLLASLVLSTPLMLVAGPAVAFGTIDTGGQNGEHGRIIRAAVACTAGTGSDDDCFEPKTTDQLAGHAKIFGAIGDPDLTEVFVPPAHCDDADFLAGDYPRTRDDATGALIDCVDHLRGRFRESVDDAKDLLDDEGRIDPLEVTLDTGCELAQRNEQRAKCTSLEYFGRALHGIQDFYSHSNWADEADPARPIGADNPPGLNLPAPSPILDLRGSGAPTVPADLTTGCYVLRDTVPGVEECERRVTHAALNKDLGLIDPDTGTATTPTTPRGMVGSNFAKAVAGAIAETRRQWQDLRTALEESYGAKKASLMICALTHDDPLNDCGSNGYAAAVVVGGALIGGLASILLIWARRRRHTGATDPADVISVG
jgi:hypothetical protein